MKSLWLFAPRGSARRVLDRLAAMGVAHVADCGLAEGEERERLGIERVYPEATEVERRVRLLRETFDIFNRFHKTKRSFLENFIPTPTEMREADVRAALAAVDVKGLHADVKQRERRYNALSQSLQKARESLKSLSVLEGAQSDIPGANAQKNVAAFLGVMSAAALERLRSDERLKETMALAAVVGEKRYVVVQAACPIDEGPELLNLLREHGMAPVEPESETVTIDEYLRHRREEVARLEDEMREADDALRSLTATHRRRVEAVLGYWEERLRIANATALMAESKRLTVLRAYVREADLDDFRERLARDLPEVSLDVRDPEPGENVPISLRNPKILAPTQFLVGMFGMPNYFAFDPTPYITISFLIFFGLCFGDAVYGVMLMAAGALLARKYRDYPGPRGMFALLGVAGITTTIVGVLTGAWASDLLTAQYMGAGNPLVLMREKLMVADIVTKTMAALAVALLLGVANQFLSLVCLMVGNIRRGDVKAAIFDGGFWLMVLPAVVVFAAGLFAEVPPVVNRAAVGFAAVGALGLVLTQGRSEKTLIGKAVIGVVSLYGIVGSYGITTFIGDVLSYSRLLALGLTTTVVGMCFNLIGGMVRGESVFGLFLLIIILLIGHTGNFFISILGAFVHSARLIFVEFFSKFYQGDAAAFAPLGAWTGRIRVVDSRTVWVE